MRVQEWEKACCLLAENDSINQKPGNSPCYNADSIKTWLANKERKKIIVKNRIPLSIRYFTCEGKMEKLFSMMIFMVKIKRLEKIFCRQINLF